MLSGIILNNFETFFHIHSSTNTSLKVISKLGTVVGGSNTGYRVIKRTLRQYSQNIIKSHEISA